MKISELTKKLNSIKRKVGDIHIGFDTLTVNEDADEFESVSDLDVLGVFKVRYEGANRHSRVLIFGQPGMDSVFSYEKDLSEAK